MLDDIGYEAAHSVIKERDIRFQRRITMVKLRIFVLLGVVILGLLGTTAVASADNHPFLCPVVGDGVLNADDHNGDNGVSTITPPVGTSFQPGNNQAGANSNPTAYNTSGPGDPDAGPGGNPDYSPIWPPPVGSDRRLTRAVVRFTLGLVLITPSPGCFICHSSAGP